MADNCGFFVCLFFSILQDQDWLFHCFLTATCLQYNIYLEPINCSAQSPLYQAANHTLYSTLTESWWYWGYSSPSRGLNYIIFEVPSNPSHSTILWFHSMIPSYLNFIILGSWEHTCTTNYPVPSGRWHYRVAYNLHSQLICCAICSHYRSLFWRLLDFWSHQKKNENT